MPSPIDIMEEAEKNSDTNQAHTTSSPSRPRNPFGEQEQPVVVAEIPTEIVVTEEYQATDDAGNPVGPPTKLIGKGATELDAYKDLVKKQTSANITAARKIKEYRDKNRQLDARIVPTMKPRELDAEAKVRIARLMNNPETIEQGYEELNAAKSGMTVPEYQQWREEQTAQSVINRGKEETNTFLAQNPDYPNTDEAKALILEALAAKAKSMGIEENDPRARGLWTAHNLQICYDELVTEGKITPKELSSQEPAPVIATVPVANTTDTSAQRIRPRGERHSSMTSVHGSVSPNATRQSEDTAFREEVKNMPLEVLKRRIRTDKKFAARIDSLK